MRMLSSFIAVFGAVVASVSAVNAVISLDKLSKAPTYCQISKEDGREIYASCSFSNLGEVYGRNIYIAPKFSGMLTRFYFSEFNLQQPNFSDVRSIDESYFRSGLISDFDFQDVAFRKVDFSETSFRNGSVSNARFESVDLSFSSLKGVTLKDVRFRDVDTFMAEFSGVDFSQTAGLGQSDFNRACGDAHTVLPPDIKRPAHWPCNAIETAVIAFLKTHIHSGSNIHWRANECPPISNDFRQLHLLDPRPGNVYRQYPLSYSDNLQWNVHIFSKKLSDKGVVHARSVENLTSAEDGCKKFYIYTQSSDAPHSYTFAARIDCVAGICSLSGAGAPNSPGQIGRLVVTLNSGEDVAEFKKYLRSAGALEIETVSFANRATLNFTYPFADRLFLVVLQRDPRVWSASRVPDAIGGTATIKFKENGVLQELVLKDAALSLHEAAIKLMQKIFPSGSKIQEIAGRGDWLRFEVTGIKKFYIETNDFWEKYTVEILFLPSSKPPMAVMLLKGDYAPGVGRTPPDAGGYYPMQNKYDQKLESLAKAFERAAQAD